MITSKKIGVLMGGLSSEREISLKTGGLAAAALQKMGYDVAAIDAGRDLPAQLARNGIGAVFIALHGKYGEDGCVQGLLEVMGIPYTGSGVTASALCMDKLLSKKILEYHGIPTPRFSVYHRGQGDGPDAPGYPLVVKPCREGSTIGVSIVSQQSELTAAIENALPYGDNVILEEYIGGMEVTAGVLDNQALPLVEIVPAEGFYDFRTKTTGGMAEYIVPARLSPSLTETVRAIALKAHKVTGCCFVSRVDLRIDPAGRPFVLEIIPYPE